MIAKEVSYENAYDCHPMNKPFVSAVLFGFHGIYLFKNLVSDFTLHFSKKSESIFFHFALLEIE